MIYSNPDCGQMDGCIKMPLGMEVGLGPGHIVLDGDPVPLPKKRTRAPIFGPFLLCLNGWSRPNFVRLSSADVVVKLTNSAIVAQSVVDQSCDPDSLTFCEVTIN